MRTVKQIANAKKTTALQKQMILGFCNDAGIITEEDLTKRKIANRAVLRQCIATLNKNNSKGDKPYINVVSSLNEIVDDHDIYVVSTTFGYRFYNKLSNAIGTPAMKLTKMLSIRCNSLDTCYVTAGQHNGLPFHYTGMLLSYVPNKYYKTNTYETINNHYDGYKDYIK